MANKTISDLRELSTVSDNNVLVVETNAETFKVTKENLLKEVNEELNTKSNINHTHDEYVTESELNAKGLATETFVESEISKIELTPGPQGPKGPKGDKGDPGTTTWEGITNKPTNLATETFVTNKIAEASISGGDVDLSAYATIEFVNQEIKEIELTPGPQGPQGERGLQGPQGPKGDAGTTSWDEITDKPTNLATETYVQEKIAEASLSGGEVDLSAYATRDYVNIKVAENTDKITVLSDKVDELKQNGGSSIAIKDIFANNELPRVYMTSDRLGLLKTKNDPEAICECEIKINNQTIRCYATGKVQGTSSASYPGKNFTFKFYSDAECASKQKIDVGWGEQHKYCFKKNWVDTTHTRNLAGARIAYDMVESRPSSDFKTHLQKAPRNGAVDGFPCKLYINGEFWGLYTWNIPKDEWMFNMDSDNPKHMVLCAEQNNNRINVNNDILKCEFRQEWDGSNGSSWSIEVGTLSDDLKNSFNRVVKFVMNSSDEEFRNNINDYFDLYSLIDYYLFSYFACHLDGLAKNMLIGTYDGVQWGVMLYDMDSIFGAHVNGASFVSPQFVCPSDYQENNSLLWQRLEKCFVEELKTRYAELRKGALSLGNVITHVEEIHDLVNDRTFNDEKSKWTQLPSVTTNTMSRFRNYMRDRAKYVDERIANLIIPVPCTGLTLSHNTMTFTSEDPQTLIATTSPNNTTDEVTWSVSPIGVVSVAKGIVKPISKGNCVVTATCGTYSATCDVNVEVELSPTQSNLVMWINSEGLTSSSTLWEDLTGNGYNFTLNGKIDVNENGVLCSSTQLRSDKAIPVTTNFSVEYVVEIVNNFNNDNTVFSFAQAGTSKYSESPYNEITYRVYGYSGDKDMPLDDVKFEVGKTYKVLTSHGDVTKVQINDGTIYQVDRGTFNGNGGAFTLWLGHTQHRKYVESIYRIKEFKLYNETIL